MEVKRQARAIATQRRLLDAAREVFGREGFHGASVHDVAHAAGVSKGALYHHFASKEDLLLALLDERITARIDDLERRFAREPAAAAAAGAAEDYATTLRTSEEWTRLFLEFVAHAGRNPRFQRELTARLQRVRGALAALVEQELRGAGVELDVSPAVAALAINALSNGLAIERLADPDAVSPDLLATLILRLVGALARQG